MPMYQYACQECGHPFEKRLAMSQSGEAQPCPYCGSLETRKRLGAVAVNAGASGPQRVSTPPPSSPFT